MKKYNSKAPAKRKLKIAARYMARASWKPAIFPEIRLCGKWLQEMGFRCGETVIVRLSNNQLIISPMNMSGVDLRISIAAEP